LCHHKFQATYPIPARVTPIGTLFGLAPGGVYHAAGCYHQRGALLPHPFTLTARKYGVGGLLSVALAVGLHPPRCYLAPYPVEPGLSSPWALPSSDCLADFPAQE